MTDAEIAELERKFEKWNGKSTILIMPTVFVSLFALPLVTLYQNSLPPIVLFAPLVPLVALLLGLKVVRRWEESTRRAIASHYEAKFMRTRWRTVADAEGVAIGVSTFGNRLTLAFGNGVTETYDRSLLAPVD
ncbi:hypothetical protein O9X98_14415 [Agrobacterium salinitolerans]|nr:hypothetical protein [Agrobacterium salinitolerans]